MQRLRKTAIQRWRHYLFYAFTLFGLVLCSSIEAQTGSKAIIFEAKEEALAGAITRLSKASGISISYPPGEVKAYKNISVPKASRTVYETLKALLKETNLDCKPVAELLVVFKKPTQTRLPQSKAQINVSGRVVDENDQPLPGITISVKNSDRGTTTDNGGAFKINNIEDDAILVVQGIGYPAQSLPATNGMLVRLVRTVSSLDEVQVIAYGTTTKRLNTGNVATVSGADIGHQPVANPIAALEGRVPGLIINQTSGVPGGALKIQIRGQNSLDLTRSKNDPLIIVDGVPFESGNQPRSQFQNASLFQGDGGISPLTLIPPSEIESIDILKDADATAIYGSRGANGIIIITTKKGKTGTTKYNLNVNSGWSSVGRTLKYMNTQEYVGMRKEAYLNDGVTPSANPSDQGYAPDIMIFDTTRYTDFTKLLLKNAANNFNAGLSVSGGTENTQFLIGGNFRRETVIYPGDFSNRTASINTSINHRSKDNRLSLGLSMQYANDNNTLPITDPTIGISYIIPNLLLRDSSGNIAAQDGGLPLNNNSFVNPLYNLETIYKIGSDNFNTSLQVGYNILKSLVFRTGLGYNVVTSDEYSANPSKSINPNNPDPLPYAYFGNSSIRSWIAEPQLEYSAKSQTGRLNVLVGSTFQDKSSKTIQTTGRGYSSDILLGSIAGAATISSSSTNTTYRYSAFFGRINYNLLDKYIVNLTGRRDGSSRFAPQNRWSNFGAAGVAWIFSNEPFIKNLESFLNFGKLRASYGITGNDQIGDYKFLDLWRTGTTTYEGTSTLTPSALYNKTYQWEINKKLEIAVELSMLKDRFFFSAAYFNNKSSNQLINYRLPYQTGFSSVTQNFPGLVKNYGLEIVANSKNITGGVLQWNTSFNISFTRNKLLHFPDLEGSPYSSSYAVGHSLNVIKGYRYLGMDRETGVYKFEDVNGDGSFNSKDYLTFGTRDPKFYGGLQNEIIYKGFELNFLFSFRRQMGNNYLSTIFQTPGYPSNQPKLVLDRWRSAGDDAASQRYTAGFSIPPGIAGNLYRSSNEAYTDASFIRLRNVAIYYNVPAGLGKAFSTAKCRIYMQGQNLLLFTNYKGADPEVADVRRTPPLKVFVIGANINF